MSGGRRQRQREKYKDSNDSVMASAGNIYNPVGGVFACACQLAFLEREPADY